MQRVLFAEDLAARPGLGQRVDPRAKLVGALAWLLAASLTHNLVFLGGLYVATVALAVVAQIPVRSFLGRVWLFVPLFTGVVVAPAAFSFVTAGDIVVPLGHWWGHRVGLTSQGLTAAARMVLRVATSVSIVTLLTSTTAWNRLVAALRTLGVPRLFVAVLAMTYRYLFHLLTAVTDMYTARRARTVRVGGGVAEGRAFVAASAGALFAKAHGLSDEVHQAMVSRGFTGDVPTVTRRRLRSIDVAVGVLSVAGAGAVVLADRAWG